MPFAAMILGTAPFFNYLPTWKREATGEGGLITGTNPAAFTTSDPLRLWIIQVSIIIIMAQLLFIGLRRLRQPKVIAEVFGGILLGPTALGRIPGFTKHIFPSESLPYLSLVANIGLCLFLFLVGLEIDTSIIKRNARTSAMVSLAGIALPFGFGSVLSIPLYHHFIDRSVPFTYFMLFTGVAYSITAFPILCRVLTELKLLDKPIGIIVLSAGVGNDVIGWTLLALSVALVNAGSGLTALWILLACIAFILFLLFPVKFVLHLLARVTGSIENGPTMFYMTVVIILVWASAFFTDAIGVNGIFGAFIVGLVVPREGGLAIALTEKLEDMVTIVFLPLFFALSGLNTNLGLLDDGITWAFTIAIIALSFTGKFGGCTIASRLAGYGWRDASTIGALMSCKGLVELIVLNVGLQAGILSQRVFSMFVLEALTLTFITTPLVTTLYSPEHHIRENATSSSLKGDEHGQSDEKAFPITGTGNAWRYRFTVVLDKLESIPGAMALTQLVIPPRSSPSDVTSTTTTSRNTKVSSVSVEALQLIELSDRTSAIMKSSAAAGLIHTDPGLDVFRMFGELNEMAVTTSLSVVPHDDFAHSVAEHAERHGSHLILLPWMPHTAPIVIDTLTPDVNGTDGTTFTHKAAKADYNPFNVLFGNVVGNKTDTSPSAIHTHFVRGVFSQSKTDVALFIDTSDRSAHGVGGGPVHVFLPFFGGPDDRLALEFVVQLCLNPRVTATVIRLVRRQGATGGEEVQRPQMAHTDDKDADWVDMDGIEVLASVPHMMTPAIQEIQAIQTTTFSDTIYDQPTTEMYLRSETADNIVWSQYVTPTIPSPATASGLRQALTRIHFSETFTPAPLNFAIRHARELRETMSTASSRLLVVVGRSRRLAMEIHREGTKWAEAYHMPHQPFCGAEAGLETMRRTLGEVGASMVVAGSASGVVVMQAAVSDQ